jgi:hypothetical protein
MLKRSLIAVAVVAILATSAQAGHLKLYDWPGHWVWDCVWFDFEIPVYMKIGMYIEITNKDGKQSWEIVMKQIEWQKYKGCTDLYIKTNFNAELCCSYTSNGTVPGEYWCYFDDKCVPATLSNEVAVRQVCVEGKKVKIVHASPNNKLRVGTLKIGAKPGC